ncbi:YlaF family protein [Chryseomicrobium sp. FSL W7-1435]|uniref:YlaF family protein n=1 Tax=Chryseomicrobium sp. FSL W7-1435 TaxID=2921704 RepID=UPI00315AFBF2
MKNLKWIFVLYSLLAIAAMASIGVAVSYRSVPFVLLAIFALIVIMGFGFKKKKEYREKGLLD